MRMATTAPAISDEITSGFVLIRPAGNMAQLSRGGHGGGSVVARGLQGSPDVEGAPLGHTWDMNGISFTTQSAGALGKAAPMPHYKEAPPPPPMSTPPRPRRSLRRPWRGTPVQPGHAGRVLTHGGRRHS